MTFRNEEHQRFYEAARFKHEGDRERLALMYLLGLDDNSRAHWRDCYDEERGLIKPNCLRQAAAAARSCSDSRSFAARTSTS